MGVVVLVCGVKVVCLKGAKGLVEVLRGIHALWGRSGGKVDGHPAVRAVVTDGRGLEDVCRRVVSKWRDGGGGKEGSEGERESLSLSLSNTRDHSYQILIGVRLLPRGEARLFGPSQVGERVRRRVVRVGVGVGRILSRAGVGTSLNG